MNLRGLANSVTQQINENQTITLKRNTGYTTDLNYNQVPTFETLTGDAQIQALGPKDLQHLSYLNIQNVSRKVYLYGNWQGVVRADSKGGDILTFPEIPGGDNRNWKVVTVFETWPDWSSVGVVLQEIE